MYSGYSMRTVIVQWFILVLLVVLSACQPQTESDSHAGPKEVKATEVSKGLVSPPVTTDQKETAKEPVQGEPVQKDRASSQESVEYGEIKIKNSTVQVFKLDNEMQVMTISDPQFSKSGAALAVEVGNYADPSEAAGMAHFLEHVLFISNEEYPQIDELMNFVSQNGGETNAYTGNMVTNYGFDVGHGAFDGALSRFSSFFYKPTFDGQFLEKEKQAVHSEYKKNLNNDSWRQNAVSKQFMNPAHPNSRFSIGSLTTLEKVDREMIVDFYQKHYSSNLMHLVLASSKSPEELKELAQKYFARIENRNLSATKYSGPIYKSNSHQLIAVKPIENKHTLSISFDAPMPKDLSWKHKVSDLVSYVLGHEGKGSLASLLKEDGLVLALSVGASEDIVSLELALTEHGLKNIPAVVNRVFNYLEFAKSVSLPKEIYKDLMSQSELSFKDLTLNPSLNSMQSLAAQLKTYRGVKTFEKARLLHEYRPDLYADFMKSYLTPERAQFLLSSPTIKGDKVEPYFNAEYGTLELLPLTIDPKSWSSFELPNSFSYFPKNFDLVNQERAIAPLAVEKLPEGELIGQVDTELGDSKAGVDIVIHSLESSNLRRRILNTLFLYAKLYEMTAWAELVQKGNYQFGFSPLGNEKLRLSVRGHSDQISRILKDFFVGTQLVSPLREFNLTEAEFQNIRDRFKATLSDIKVMEPYSVVNFYAPLLFIGHESLAEHIAAVDTIQLSEVRQYAHDYFNNNYLQIYSYGNWTLAQSHQIYDDFYRTMGRNPEGGALAAGVERSHEPTQPLYRWPADGQRYDFVVKGSNSNNGIRQFWDFGPWTLEGDVYGTFLGLLIGNAYFEELRTRQQLGYVVDAGIDISLGRINLASLIQSNRHPKELAQLSADFLPKMISEKKENFTEEQFQTLKVILVEQLEKLSPQMGARVESFFMQHYLFPMNFDYKAEKLKQIKNATREGFLVWLDKSLEALRKPPTVTISYYAPTAELRSDLSVKPITEEDIKSLTWPKSNPFFENAKSSVEIPVAVLSLGETPTGQAPSGSVSSGSAPSIEAPSLISDPSTVVAPEVDKTKANGEATAEAPAPAPAPAAIHAPAPATETATKTPAEASSGVAVDLSTLK